MLNENIHKLLQSPIENDILIGIEIVKNADLEDIRRFFGKYGLFEGKATGVKGIYFKKRQESIVSYYFIMGEYVLVINNLFIKIRPLHLRPLEKHFEKYYK